MNSTSAIAAGSIATVRSAAMNAYRGPPMTVDSTATARVRLVFAVSPVESRPTVIEDVFWTSMCFLVVLSAQPMTDERQRSQDELRAFLALFDPWKTIVVGATLSTAVLAVAVALAMLFHARY